MKCRKENYTQEKYHWNHFLKSTSQRLNCISSSFFFSFSRFLSFFFLSLLLFLCFGNESWNGKKTTFVQEKENGNQKNKIEKERRKRKEESKETKGMITQWLRFSQEMSSSKRKPNDKHFHVNLDPFFIPFLFPFFPLTLWLFLFNPIPSLKMQVSLSLSLSESFENLEFLSLWNRAESERERKRDLPILQKNRRMQSCNQMSTMCPSTLFSKCI